MRHYSAAADGSPNKILAWIGKAQMHMLLGPHSWIHLSRRWTDLYPWPDELPAAVHTLDTLISNRSECMEATVMLAAICAHPGPALSATDAATEKKKARDIFERIGRQISASRQRSIKYLGEDADMHIDIARLWQAESLERASKAYKEAARIQAAQAPAEAVDPRLSNDLGVMHHLEGDLPAAQKLYEEAITNAALNSQDADTLITTMMYNLARVYEEQGESNKAREAYDKLLGKHPEYIDGKQSNPCRYILPKLTLST